MNVTKQIQRLEKELAELKQLCLDPEPQLPEMVDIPDRSYRMGKYLVTEAQYAAFCQAAGKSIKDLKNPNHPVTSITYREAVEYAEWLSQQTGKHYRLPTEDEWEYCCADHKEASPGIAVYNQDSITEVGTKKPNKFGLYDMLGLAWEFTRIPGENK